MKLITRSYLQRLINVIGTPEIKVITGVRRSGKSQLLQTFKDHIETHLTNYNIIYIDFNSLDFADIREYRALNQYIEAHYISGKHNFLLIDEIQLCQQFEWTINSLHNSTKYDIYITGSNAFLLSNDLATLFTGRSFLIEIFPFSFAEFTEYHQLTDYNHAFERYILEGGLAGSYNYSEIEEKYHYIKEVFDTLIVRDIKQRYNIQYPTLIHNISDFLMDNISNLTSVRNITNLLHNQGATNDKTVGSYIKYLCDAFAFYKIRRYDIQGKQYLATQDKYYLSDHAFKFATLGTKNINYGRVLENIVAIELLRRGYEVYVGKLYQKEIDFVATKRNQKIYVQVADDISQDSTLHREATPLLEIRDAYPKLILARTHHDVYTYDGIEVHNLADWLLT